MLDDSIATSRRQEGLEELQTPEEFQEEYMLSLSTEKTCC